MFFSPRNVFYNDVITFPTSKSAGALTLYSEEYGLTNASKSHIILYADDLSKITNNLVVYVKGSFNRGTSWETLGTYTDLVNGSGSLTLRKEVPYAPLIKVEAVFDGSGALASGHGVGIDVVIEESEKQLSKKFFSDVVNVSSGSAESAYFDVSLTEGSKETATFSITDLPTSNGSISVAGVNIPVYNTDVAEVVTLTVTGTASLGVNNEEISVVLPGLEPVIIGVDGGNRPRVEFTVTDAPTSSGNITFTTEDTDLNVYAPVVVAVLDSDTTEQVAAKIKAAYELAAFSNIIISNGSTNSSFIIEYDNTIDGYQVVVTFEDTDVTGASVDTPNASGSSPDSIDIIAEGIRQATFIGWTTGGADAVVTFTKNVAGAVAGAAQFFTETVDGTIATTTVGGDTDTLSSIATKIAAAAYDDWDASAVDEVVSFVGKENGNLTDLAVNVGATGMVISAITKVDGVASPEVGNVTIGGETFALTTVASDDAIAADIAEHSFTNWDVSSTDNRVTFVAKTLENVSDLTASSSATGVSFSAVTTTQGIAVAGSQTVNGTSLSTDEGVFIKNVEIVATGIAANINNTTLYVDGSLDGSSWYRVDSNGTAFNAASVSFASSGFVGRFARAVIVTASNGSLESGHSIKINAALKY